jgi:type IV secretory pathway VirB2 component (pilin)
VGAVAGTPGALYITALHLLVKGESPTAVQAAGVAGFVVIEFALVIIPFAFLAARPQATERAVQRLRDWLTGHARELLAGAAVLAGGYMVISGTVRLLS